MQNKQITSRRNFLKIAGAMTIFVPSFNLLSFESKNNLLFDELVHKAKKNKWNELPMSELMKNIALEFIDIPYVGGTLDENSKEVCTVLLDKLDCVTYFETVLGLAICFKKSQYSFSELVSQIQKTRYRNGVIENYTSRLHYTADWIYENVKNYVISDITKDIGGQKIFFDTYFMSKNPLHYKSLNSNPEFVEIIKKQENEINKREYYYIPKEKLGKKIKGIETCDIIALTTSLKGLDYSHIGFAYKNKDGEIQFLHASSAKKKVVLDTFLSDYLNGKKNDTGITVLRAN